MDQAKQFAAWDRLLEDRREIYVETGRYKGCHPNRLKAYAARREGIRLSRAYSEGLYRLEKIS